MEEMPGKEGDTRPTKVRQRRRRARGWLARVALWSLWAIVAGGLVLTGAAAGFMATAPGDVVISVDVEFFEDLARAYGIDWIENVDPTPTLDSVLVENALALARGMPTETALQPQARDTDTPTPSATSTPSETPTSTGTGTATETASSTPSATGTSTATATPGPSTTVVIWPTWTPTRTPSRTPTRTPSRTPTPGPSRTPTPTVPTPTPTSSFTPPPPTDTPGPGTVFPTDTPTPTTPPPTATQVPPTATQASGCNPSGNSGFENTLLGLINTERQNQGLRAYSMQSQLQAAARIHSADMACNGFVSHTGSDGSGVRDRVERQGYSWSWIGENIYTTSDTSSGAPQRVFDWWMNSGPHRANLMSPNYTEIGLGYRYANGRGAFTAVFARP